MSDEPNLLPNGRPNIEAMSGPQAQQFLDGRLADSSWAARLSSRDKSVYAEFTALNRKALGLDAAPVVVSDHAQGQLDRFVSDPSTAKALLAGDPSTNRRCRELTEAA